jgi:hypothetical protein
MRVEMTNLDRTDDGRLGDRALDPQSDHAGLDRAIRELESLLLEEGTVAIRERWRALELRVRRHLAHEELSVLTAYDAHDSEAARAIEAAHDDLRTRLRACRERLATGEIDTTALREVLQRYRIHQIREDTTMYRWVAEQRREAPAC